MTENEGEQYGQWVFILVLVVVIAIWAYLAWDIFLRESLPHEYGSNAAITGPYQDSYDKHLCFESGQDSRLCDLEQKIEQIDQTLNELQKQAKNQDGERAYND